MKRVVRWFFALFCFLFGTAFLLLGAMMLYEDHSAREWTPINGVVTATSIRETNSKSGVMWCPNWEYQYTVSGKEYVGTRVAVGEMTCEKSFDAAKARINAQPINSVIAVIYDPSSPQKSALFISDGFSKWFFLGLGMVFIILSWFIAYSKQPIYILPKAELAQIEDRFRRVVIHSSNPRYAFSGTEAKVIHDFEKGIPQDGLGVWLNRICTNRYGEYFHVLIMENEAHHAKYLTKTEAERVLEGFSVSPSDCDK